jgi:Asp-tRNA(Asn)/Glu-tRNA(Gln) amidotransferase A subunit family amidase
MARDSADAALFLDALAVEKSVWPLSALPTHAAHPVELDGLRIAWSVDAGGLPIDADVAAVHAAFAGVPSVGAIGSMDTSHVHRPHQQRRRGVGGGAIDAGAVGAPPVVRVFSFTLFPM